MMRRYLAQWPDEVLRIFRMLDLVAHGAEGHGLAHLLLVSANELGFTWVLEDKGWVRAAFPPLWMLSGPALSWRVGRGFDVLNLLTSKDLYNYITLPICGKEIK